MTRHPRNMGHLRPPTVDDLQRAAAHDGFELGPEADAFAGFAAGLLRLLDEVEDLPDRAVPVRYAREPADGRPWTRIRSTPSSASARSTAPTRTARRAPDRSEGLRRRQACR
jgi:hypothetical protein